MDQNASGWISRASTPLQSNSRVNSRTDYHHNCRHYQQNDYINPYLPPPIPFWKSHYSIQYQYPDYYHYFAVPQIPQNSYIHQYIDEPYKTSYIDETYPKQYIDEPYETYEPYDQMLVSVPENIPNPPKKSITFSKTVRSKEIKPLIRKKEPDTKKSLGRKSIPRIRHAKDVLSQKPKGDFRKLYDSIQKKNSMQVLSDEC